VVSEKSMKTLPVQLITAQTEDATISDRNQKEYSSLSSPLYKTAAAVQSYSLFQGDTGSSFL
jgi:hypothetical protein